MKVGLFFEHQCPRPWVPGFEEAVFNEYLEQVSQADALGFSSMWLVEHHFLEEYSHCSSPELLLAAASQRTQKMRLGHGVRLMPPGFCPPVRIAEGIATLDLISNGRVEWGTGSCSSKMELEGYGVPYAERHLMWEESVREVARMLALDVYPGHDGSYFKMPPRQVLPKPKQGPHPPMWMACSHRDTIRIAARHGIGALTFAFLTPAEAKEWVDDYHRIFREECVPLGITPNPKVAMIAGFGCHRYRPEAVNRFEEGFRFYEFALRYYYLFGRHKPGHTSIHDLFVQYGRGRGPHWGRSPFFNTPKGLQSLYKAYEEAGVDEIILVQQVGNTKHEHILEANALLAEEVLPDLLERDVAASARRADGLEEAVAMAMARKAARPEQPEDGPPDDYVVDAYGLDQDPSLLIQS